jgi:hypothetical protein
MYDLFALDADYIHAIWRGYSGATCYAKYPSWNAFDVGISYEGKLSNFF